MTMMIEYSRGTSKGGISDNTYAGEKTYIACTATNSKTFKTLKGAEKFMAKNGYERA